MDRPEMRELEYFVAVAEHLHFGRAAEQVGIAQPPLSRAIARLERRLGVRLFDRTSRRVALTEAGTAFLREGRKTLAAADSAVRHARDAARPQRLVLAVRSGTGAGVLAELVEAYRREPDAVPLEVLFTADQPAALRDGSADVAVLCETDDLAGFDTEAVADESAFVLLPLGHELAGRARLSAAEVCADPMFRSQCPPVGLDEIIDRIALGALVVVVGEGAARRADQVVATVPVTDLPVSRIVLAWPHDVPSPARDVLLRAARASAA